jgi:hypothetical protein
MILIFKEKLLAHHSLKMWIALDMSVMFNNILYQIVPKSTVGQKRAPAFQQAVSQQRESRGPDGLTDLGQESALF